MADDVIRLLAFGGEVPVSPPDLLPLNAAQYAENCDFAHGHLMPLKGGFLLTTLASTVKSVYTDDGINFYSWTTESFPLRSPVAKDPYDRIYFLEGGVLKVTTRAGVSPTGGPPASSWKVGVPHPTVAPGLAKVDLNEYPDYPGATITVHAWWESAYERFQEFDATLTEVSRLRKYTFAMPAFTGGTPTDSVARITLAAKDSAGKQFMTATITLGDSDTRSTALPGNVTFGFAVSSTGVYTVTLDYGVAETRAYVYTTENNWLEESGPSPAAQIDTTYLQSVAVTLGAVDFTGYRPLLQYNTYRTMGASAAYLLVKEATALTYTDGSHKASDILGSLDTLDYESPPAQMDNLASMANGCFVGSSGNTVYFTEPYRVHTWQYQMPFQKSVRGLCPAPQSLIVTTAEKGFAVVGNHPSSMQPLELNVPQAGISQRSMVNLDGSTAYASHDGIVAVSGSQGSLRGSQRLFARSDWQTQYGAILADGSLHFGWHDGQLVATSSTHPLGFLLNLDGEETGQYTRFNVQMDSMYQLPVTDSLYYSVGADIYQFRGGSNLAYTWWSKDFLFARPRNMGAGYIRSSGSVTLSVYANGALLVTKVLTGTRYFRLKGGKRYSRLSFKLTGSATVEEFALARTMRELQRA